MPQPSRCPTSRPSHDSKLVCHSNLCTQLPASLCVPHVPRPLVPGTQACGCQHLSQPEFAGLHREKPCGEPLEPGLAGSRGRSQSSGVDRLRALGRGPRGGRPSRPGPHGARRAMSRRPALLLAAQVALACLAARPPRAAAQWVSQPFTPNLTANPPAVTWATRMMTFTPSGPQYNVSGVNQPTITSVVIDATTYPAFANDWAVQYTVPGGPPPGCWAN